MFDSFPGIQADPLSTLDGTDFYKWLWDTMKKQIFNLYMYITPLKIIKMNSLPEKLGGVCSLLPKALTFFETKIWDFSYLFMIHPSKNLIPYHNQFKTNAKTIPLFMIKMDTQFKTKTAEDYTLLSYTYLYIYLYSPYKEVTPMGKIR